MPPPEPRLIAHLVTRNEADRYLPQCLGWLGSIVDDVHVYDDASTDGTAGMCREFEAHVTVRAEGVPSFLEHEGRFRQAGWYAMEQAMQPDEETWIVVVDADEFLVARGGDEKLAIAADICEAQTLNMDAVVVKVAEVWAFARTTPLVRADGWWGKITAPRLVRWRPKAAFDDRREGGGSVPDYATARYKSERLDLLHLGYTCEADRRTRHDRYSKGRGHNPRHIDSILAAPDLRSWDGNVPLLVRRLADPRAS
jgi:glycosyltransferase involved in cell wall biosynthesis